MEITPEKTEIKTGEKLDFTVEVKGKGAFSKEVSWEVSGNQNKNTKIDEKGSLSVGKEETAGELKIKAVSKADKTKFDEVIVKVRKEEKKAPEKDKNKNTGNKTAGQGVKTVDENQIAVCLLMLFVSGIGLSVCGRKGQTEPMCIVCSAKDVMWKCGLEAFAFQVFSHGIFLFYLYKWNKQENI